MECVPPTPPMGRDFTSSSYNDLEFSKGVTMGREVDLPKLSSTGKILYTTFFAPICLIIIACNAVVITVLAKMEKLKGQSVYKVSIAVSDLIQGVIVIPWFIGGSIHADTRTPIMANIYECIQRASWMVSVYSLLAMGFDRLYAVLRPMNYNSDKSRKMAVRATIVIWCISSLIEIFLDILLPVTSIVSEKTEHGGIWGHVLGGAVLLAVALLLLWTNNFIVYCVVKKKMNAAFLGDNIILSPSRLKKQRRVVITPCIMTAAFTFSTLPFLVFSGMLVHDICILFHPEYEILGAIVFSLFLTNCIWNCIVYSFRQKDFRDKAKKIFLTCGRNASFKEDEG